MEARIAKKFSLHINEDHPNKYTVRYSYVYHLLAVCEKWLKSCKNFSGGAREPPPPTCQLYSKCKKKVQNELTTSWEQEWSYKKIT